MKRNYQLQNKKFKNFLKRKTNLKKLKRKFDGLSSKKLILMNHSESNFYEDSQANSLLYIF